MFVGRQKELEQLDKFYSRQGLQIISVYGRRRVGKTLLLKTFAEDKRCLFFAAEETTDRINLEKISAVYGELIEQPVGTIESWENIFENLDRLSKKERIVIVIDEFPYLQSSNSGFLSKFQHIIDNILVESNVLLILCGSSIAFMESELISHKSPLFGRLDGQVYVKPFDYYDASKMMGSYNHLEKLETYFILGGIPQYLKKFDYTVALESNIIDRILDATEELFNAPTNMIKQELRVPTVYNAILSVVSEGASRSNEINTKIGVSSTVGQNYISTLVNLHLLKKEIPVGSDSKRKTLYSIDDGLFNFVYGLCYKYKSAIELGLGKAIYQDEIVKRMETYFGKRFEVACLEYVQRLNEKLKLPGIVLEIGRWWGSDPKTKREEEIDIVGFGSGFGLYCECKYRNQPVGTDVFQSLVNKSYLIPREAMYYFLFSKTGFTDALSQLAKENPHIQLIDAKAMFEL